MDMIRGKLNYYKMIAKRMFEGISETAEINIVNNNVCSATINVDGYKHSMVGVIALAIAARANIIIDNPPFVSDTFVFVAIINEIGGKAKIFEDKLYIDARNICSSSIPIFLGKCIHGSLYLCPALMVAMNDFVFSGSGGCQIGDNAEDNKRPIAHVMTVMEKFGGVITWDKQKIRGKLAVNVDLNEIDIFEYSTNEYFVSGPLVGGATKTALILSIMCTNKFVIKNAYLKTDVLDMIRFMRKLGKNIVICDKDIIINDSITLQDSIVSFSLTECISEIITYGTLALACKKKITFLNLNRSVLQKSIKPELELLKKIGCICYWDGDNLSLSLERNIKSCDIEVLPDTIQSDHHPFFVLLMLFSDHKSTLTEYVWKDRFMYVENLRKMGANISVENNKIVVNPSKLEAFNMEMPALDVRSAAVTLLAMILSNSKATLVGSEHILRGYSRLQEQLKKMGVDITIKFV